VSFGQAWTSKTVPKLPKRPAHMSEEQYSDLYFARMKAVAELEQAEAREKEAAAKRRFANQARDHYASLLEGLFTDPLFEVVTDPRDDANIESARRLQFLREQRGEM